MKHPTACQLLAMPEAERDRILSEAAAHAAPLYEADLALPPERRDLTAISAIEDGIYDYHREGATDRGDVEEGRDKPYPYGTP